MDIQENVHRFTVADYVVFAAMLVISAGIGVYYACTGNRQSTTKEFLFGGKSMRVIPVAISVLATFLSAITLLGVPAESYQFGIQYWIIVLAYCFMIPVAANVYMPVFYKLQVCSVNEYLGKRFSPSVQYLGFAISTLAQLVYIAFVVYAPSLVLSQVTGLHPWLCVSSIGIVCTFYTATGGIKAVIWTDVFQTIIIFVALFTVVIKGTMDVGGISEVWNKAQSSGRTELFIFDPDPTIRYTFWTLTIGGFFVWLSIYAVSQPMIQRSLTIPTIRGAKTVIWLNLPGNILSLTITILAGLIIYANYSTCDPIKTKQVSSPNQMLPLFVMDTLGFLPGLPGLFVAGIFSGALSTLSSALNSLAAVTLEDIVRTCIAPNMTDALATKVAKLLAVAYGVVALIMIVIVENMPGTVIQAALTISGTFNGPYLGIFSLGMFFPWPTPLGAIVGFFCGLSVSMWICIGAFLNQRPLITAPLSVDSCMDLYLNVTGAQTNMLNSPAITYADNDDVFVLYRISFLWYSAIGCIITVLVGLLCCLITGNQEKEKLDSNLMCSLCYRLWGCKIKNQVASTEMNDTTVNSLAIQAPEERNDKSCLSASKCSIIPNDEIMGVYKKRSSDLPG